VSEPEEIACLRLGQGISTLAPLGTSVDRAAAARR
jgi:hypothetical protein